MNMKIKFCTYGLHIDIQSLFYSKTRCVGNITNSDTLYTTVTIILFQKKKNK